MSRRVLLGLKIRDKGGWPIFCRQNILGSSRLFTSNWIWGEDRAGVHPCTRLPADISLGKIKILRKFDHSLGRKDDSTFTFYHLWKWTLARTETQRCLNPFTSRKECVEIGVVSWLQNAESLCLQSQSLLVNNFINWSWADPETYPSPSCCPTMEEEVMGGMRDHLWL